MARQSYEPINHSGGSAVATELAETSRGGARGALRGIIIGALVPVALLAAAGVGMAALFGGGALAMTVVGVTAGAVGLFGSALGATWGAVAGGVLGSARGFDRGEARVEQERAAARAQSAYDRQRAGLESVVQAQMADAQARMALAQAIMSQGGVPGAQVAAYGDASTAALAGEAAVADETILAAKKDDKKKDVHDRGGWGTTPPEAPKAALVAEATPQQATGGYSDVSATIPAARSSIEVPSSTDVPSAKVNAASIDVATMHAMQEQAAVEHGHSQA